MRAELEQVMRYRLIAQRLRAIADAHPEFRLPLVLAAQDYDAKANTIEATCRLPDTRQAIAEVASAGLDEPD
jgi:hypothetical protein